MAVLVGVIRGYQGSLSGGVSVEAACKEAREGLAESLSCSADGFCSCTSPKKRFLSSNIAAWTCFCLSRYWFGGAHHFCFSGLSWRDSVTFVS